MKIWAVFEGKGFRESIDLEGDVVAVAFRPDGQQFVTSSLKGMLEVWAYKDQEHVATIDCRRDLLGGRRATDKVGKRRKRRSSGMGKGGFLTIENLVVYDRPGHRQTTSRRSLLYELVFLSRWIMSPRWRTVSIW